MNKTKFLLLVFCIFNFYFVLQAQDVVNIKPLLDMIRDGRSEEVKKLLPMLTQENPTDPGVMFLNAAFNDDAQAAVIVFKNVVKNYQETLAAKESAKRLINYFQLLGDTKSAEPYITFLGGNIETKSVAQETKKINSSLQAQSKIEKPKPISNSKFYVQTGAFSTKANGTAQLKKITKKKLKGSVVKEGKLFKVKVGPFSSQADAEKAMETLKKQLSIKGFIVEQ